MRHVGIDLGLKGPHRAAVFDDGLALMKPFRMERGVAGIDDLERRAVGVSGESLEIVMEPTGLAWLHLAAELVRRGHQVFMPKGSKISALRKFYSLHTKSDSIDAYAQGMVRHVDPEGTYPLVIPTASQTMLRMFVKQRARLTDDLGRFKTRLRGWLVLANPALGNALVGARLFSKPARAVLRKRLDPFSVRAAGREALEQFLSTYCQRKQGDAIIDDVWQASLRTCDEYEALHAEGTLPFDYVRLQLLIASELTRIESIEAEVATFEAEIDVLYSEIDAEKTLQREVPGIGAAIAPMFEAFVGPVQRFSNSRAFCAYFGYVPRTKQTGGKPGSSQRMTKSGPNLGKQYIFLAAETGRRLDPEFALTYKRATEGGRHHIDAVCIVAHQLLRRTYAILKLREQRNAALAQGQPAKPVRWRYIDPETGVVLTKRDAHAWVAQHCPSKAEAQRRLVESEAEAEAAAGVPVSGSPTTDATTATPSQPPMGAVPCETADGKAIRTLLEDLVDRLRTNAKDEPRPRKRT